MQIQRDKYLNKLIAKKGNGLIKIITGIRRCGKSYLLFNLFNDQLVQNGVSKDCIIKIALDDRANIKLRDPDTIFKYVKDIVSSDKRFYYLMLDEVQYIKEFEDVLNSFLHINNLDVYVTGSNSKFLSSDIITEFRGRGDETRIHPLSFKEYKEAYSGSVDEAWNDYYLYGGLPYTLYLKSEEEKKEYLSSLFKTVYVSDILERYKIKHPEELDELIDILASYVGSYTNPLKLSNTFNTKKKVKITDVTIKKYINYLEDAFFISKVKKYNIKGKNYINSSSKYYFEDVGLRNARFNHRQDEEAHLMENILYNNLIIMGYTVDAGIVESFGKDKLNKTVRKNYEVDFIANKGEERIYIQSALSIPSSEKQDQELNSFRNIPDSFRKIIVVKDNIKLRRYEDGVELIGLKHFLLNDW